VSAEDTCRDIHHLMADNIFSEEKQSLFLQKQCVQVCRLSQRVAQSCVKRRRRDSGSGYKNRILYKSSSVTLRSLHL